MSHTKSFCIAWISFFFCTAHKKCLFTTKFFVLAQNVLKYMQKNYFEFFDIYKFIFWAVGASTPTTRNGFPKRRSSLPTCKWAKPTMYRVCDCVRSGIGDPHASSISCVVGKTKNCEAGYLEKGMSGTFQQFNYSVVCSVRVDVRSFCTRAHRQRHGAGKEAVM